MRVLDAMRASIVGVSAALLFAGAAGANDVAAGFDLWTTPPGGAVNDFGDVSPTAPGNVPPIPPDFFFPGSNPFTGVVDFVGVPIPTFMGQSSAPADTIVERQGTASLSGPFPSQDTVPIELVELSLQSIAPITVNPGGTLWDIEVLPSPINPSQGTMTIDHLNASGGAYDATLDVCPLLIFREINPPFRIAQQDYCSDVDPLGQQIQVFGQPWVHQVVPPKVSPLSGPGFFVIGQTNHSGPHPAADPIEQGLVPVPSVGPWGLLLAAMLIGAGGVLAVRRYGPAGRPA